jgi:hypothetical protein
MIVIVLLFLQTKRSSKIESFFCLTFYCTKVNYSTDKRQFLHIYNKTMFYFCSVKFNKQSNT